MPSALYVANTEGLVALAAAATAKTIIGVKGDAGVGIMLKEVWFAFDGVTASEKPILVELCYSTWATNPPGTNSTAVSVNQTAGRAIAETFSAAKNWTSEPTTLTAFEPFDYDPAKGMYRYAYALGDEYDSAIAEGFALRMTIPSGGAAVNTRAGLRFGRV